jgi:type IV fimbrial biogenesis protein FimT
LPSARSRGFTFVEITIALAIVALLGTLALPAFGDWIAAYQLGNYARHLAETMTQARTEAVRRGQRINLCKSADQHRCANAGGWERGFIVHVDDDRNGQIGDVEALLTSDGAAPSGVTVEANRPLDAYVSFTSAGHARMLSGALQMGTLVVCRRGQLARNVVLSAGGRVRVETAAERCP